MIVRPGPDRIPPGQCPGGLVIHHYTVPADRGPGAVLIHAVAVRHDPEMDALTAADVICDLFPANDICLVIFDGDSGDRLPPPPGYTSGDRFP